MAGPLVRALKEGQVLVIDELDARLHPIMTREIVSLFNTRETNPNHAQLIFTTQDTNLLDNSLFRRDQIWFTDKDRLGASHLYSLAEFNVRNDEAYERNYVKENMERYPFWATCGEFWRLLDAWPRKDEKRTEGLPPQKRQCSGTLTALSTCLRRGQDRT